MLRSWIVICSELATQAIVLELEDWGREALFEHSGNRQSRYHAIK
jgi:hypothetical protein